MQEDLFESAGGTRGPLAVRMRPRSLDEVVGQQHLTGAGMPLARLLEPATGQQSSSVILWGGPGTGKTTLASLAASVSGRAYVELSATSSGVADIRKVITDAKNTKTLYGKDTILFLDEIHRYSKSQQDALLPAVENGWVTLIGATTENPSFSVISPLLSRSLLLTLNPLTDEDLRNLVIRALTSERGLQGVVQVDDEAMVLLLRYAEGDARRILTALESAAQAAHAQTVSSIKGSESGQPGEDAIPKVTAEIVRSAVARVGLRYDRDGDQHYDVISAFIKSLRGSDVDAALHYLARMIVAGEDPRFIARRLIVHASEDVGFADPTALHTAVAAAQTVALVGMPEARLALAQATIHIALAPKSNAVYTAIGAAIADVEAGRSGPIPTHIRDAHYAGAARLGHGRGYLYPHDFPEAVILQQYLPDTLTGRTYFTPKGNGREASWRDRWVALSAYLRGKRTSPTELTQQTANTQSETETETETIKCNKNTIQKRKAADTGSES